MVADSGIDVKTEKTPADPRHERVVAKYTAVVSIALTRVILLVSTHPAPCAAGPVLNTAPYATPLRSVQVVGIGAAVWRTKWSLL
jgi:hypothetical protein